MKRNRTTLFITISSIALLLVLVIQVNWIFQTAKNKETLFNERANMVLARTTEALLADKQTCGKIVNGVGKKETHTIDSLFTHFMNFYNFHVDYSFEVVKPKARIEPNVIAEPNLAVIRTKNRFVNNFDPNTNSNQKGCYQKGLEEVGNKSGWELKLIFPEKKQFILAEMGTLFITSIILILAVIVLFWRTTQSLLLEKKISEHTTDFLNNMTHELKTPLTNIALAGKMIIRDSSNGHDDKIKHYSEIILQENEKLKLQVEQVLSMTALERGEIPLRKTALDMHLLIQDALKFISIQIEHKQGTLKLNLDAEKFVVMADKTHLTNAFCNLIDNAIKYSPEKPELAVQTFNEAQQLIIVISDKGMGIEKQYHKKVFDKFFRVPAGDVHDVKGFGLGLSYVKKIIELHGGSIELQSGKGEGLSAVRVPVFSAQAGTIFILTLSYV
jgi:two-component system phosphate regulon sensor histidine kinase PhoR